MDLIKQAEKLAPVLRETARETETNRKPLDHRLLYRAQFVALQLNGADK